MFSELAKNQFCFFLLLIMQKKADNFWQILGFFLPTIQRFAQFFCQRNWINIFFGEKTKIFLVKPWILSTNDPAVLAIFCHKRVDWHFFCQKTKIGTTSKLAKTRKMRFWSTCFDLLTKIKICAHSRGMILC